ncbi:acid-sensing ion channel 2 [Hydra vulgaris]|nr:acid-sensing ion channel 2 [Hydra vulgaris]XP_012559267.2 acid-sensing ion channel 2 [Hydra vulgaris]XP_012559269.2 acid-sensing ion channel 2 [Hydra vulgaris]XP_012559270.2 acid-sensing ion channel 2 [Hydra vulgaris]
MSSIARFANIAKVSSRHVDDVSKKESEPLIEKKDEEIDILLKNKDAIFNNETKHENKKSFKRWSLLKEHPNYSQIINEVVEVPDFQETDTNKKLISQGTDTKEVPNFQETSTKEITNFQGTESKNDEASDKIVLPADNQSVDSEVTLNLSGNTKWAALTKKNAKKIILESDKLKQPVLSLSSDSTSQTDNKILNNKNSLGKSKWNAVRERTNSIKNTKDDVNSNEKPSLPKLLQVVNTATATKTAASKFLEASQMRVNLKARMRKIVQERLTVKQIFKRYVESSTLHGFCYVCGDTFLVRRVLWALLMILGAIYFIIKLRYGIEEYLNYPFSTLSTVDYVHELFFPAMSLCATNSYLASMVSKNQLKLLYDEGRLPLDNNQTNPSYNMSGNELVKAIQESSLSIESMLAFCDWIQQDTNNPDIPPNPCGPQNFTTYLNYKGEQCYTLNSGLEGHKLLKVDTVGLTYGYELIFDLQTNKVIKNNQFSGMRVVIHNQDVPPQLADGFIIPPGFKTFVKMGTVQSKSLPPPYSTECGTKKLKYYNTYSQRFCLLETLTDFTGKLCGCRDVFMPENGLPFCSLKELYSCMYPAKESFSEFTMRKECPADCEERTYPYELSEARFIHNPPIGLSIQGLANLQHKKHLEEELYLSKLAQSMTSEELDAYVEDNIVSVIFFFGDTRIDYNEQEATNDFFQFLGNMGGEFGLMLGASLLTFVEFVDLFIFLIYHQMLRLHTLKKVPDIFGRKRSRINEYIKKREKTRV